MLQVNQFRGGQFIEIAQYDPFNDELEFVVDELSLFTGKKWTFDLLLLSDVLKHIEQQLNYEKTIEILCIDFIYIVLRIKSKTFYQIK